MICIKLKEHHFDAICTIEEQNQLSPWSRDEFQRCIDLAHRHAWVALDNEAPVGFIVMALQGSEAELLSISVERNHQGHGIGQLLLRESLAALNPALVFLEVRESNHRAIRFYEEYGFVQIGQRKGYYPAVNGRENALLFALDTAISELD